MVARLSHWQQGRRFESSPRNRLYSYKHYAAAVREARGRTGDDSGKSDKPKVFQHFSSFVRWFDSIHPRPMNTKEINEKLLSCKALQGKSVQDICLSELFVKNIGRYWTAQQADRKAAEASFAAMKVNGAIGPMAKLPSHPIVSLMHLSAQDMALEYMMVIGKVSERSAAERKYIQQLGRQAYNLTILQMASEEFPELKELYETKTSN